MDIETAKSLPLRELQREYRSYLEMCGFSRNTIMTAGNDSFYLWNKAGVDIFGRL